MPKTYASIGGAGFVHIAGTETITGAKTFATDTAMSNVNIGQGSTLRLYNTSDQTTNYERLGFAWTSNLMITQTEAGGTGVVRDAQFGNSNRSLRVAATSTTSGGYQFAGGSTATAGAVGIMASYTTTATSGIFKSISFTPTINQTSTGGYTAIFANVTETATGSGNKMLMDLQVGSSSKLSVSNIGTVTMIDGANMVFGTTTGTQIGQTGAKWALAGGTPSITSTGWSTSGGTPTKVLTNGSPTTVNASAVLAALITELLSKGIISA